MDWSLFTKIVDEAVDLGCAHFIPFRVNEPLIDPYFFNRMEYFRNKGVKLVSIFTNANSLYDAVATQLIEYQDIIEAVTISFHGGTPEIYQKNMGLSFERVCNNINTFMAMEHDIPVDIYCLHWSTLEAGEEQFKELWKPYSFRSVEIRASMEWAGDRLDTHTVSSETKGRDDVYRIACPRVVSQLDVMVDGRVPLCCVDAHGHVVFGDLNTQSIEEVWNSDERKRYREAHLEGRFETLPFCSTCSVNIRE
jgi:MoaA/NifB/PqqE/SkfB family radical SAM enzyme